MVFNKLKFYIEIKMHYLLLEMGQNLTPSFKNRTMLASDKECEASIFAGGDLNVGTSILSDCLTCSQRFTLAKSVCIVQLPFFIWHMEYLYKHEYW